MATARAKLAAPMTGRSSRSADFETTEGDLETALERAPDEAGREAKQNMVHFIAAIEPRRGSRLRPTPG
ncbi:hypothetical protein [Nannocystis punicea]|uniref:Uncharacterized protein n=1 Tax=Nannocystis punicea TaxID=2995304 RepID=A0ABY7HD20_9BACT|nr:hypothetical protein [Nannocystis poenicansa]WAS97167.1 hypothetical protein O0S08_13550 [Nannocystis poenicansa]